jgi:hypothetical protein
MFQSPEGHRGAKQKATVNPISPMAVNEGVRQKREQHNINKGSIDTNAKKLKLNKDTRGYIRTIRRCAV